MNIELEKNVASEEILAFLKKINSDVYPPLDERVTLADYAQKLAGLADCLIIRENEQIEGLSAVYCNDYDTHKSYLTLIAVSRKLRNQGVAAKLLDETIQHIKRKGMKTLVLETHEQNQPAIKFYTKYGFEVIESNKDGVVFMNYRLG